MSGFISLGFVGLLLALAVWVKRSGRKRREADLRAWREFDALRRVREAEEYARQLAENQAALAECCRIEHESWEEYAALCKLYRERTGLFPPLARRRYGAIMLTGEYRQYFAPQLAPVGLLRELLGQPDAEDVI